ncbi:MAG: hypothetical protein ACJA2D_001468 [Pseudohongiellaceae bacterium]
MSNFFKYALNALLCSSLESVIGITVLAAQRTTCEAYKNRRQARGPRFALQRMEYLGYA